MILVKQMSSTENSFCEQSSQIYVADINLLNVKVWYDSNFGV